MPYERLDPQLDDYLAFRRALGFRLVRQASSSAQFTAFLDARGEDTITVEAALAWATLPRRAGPAGSRMRLSVGARFRRLPARARSGARGAAPPAAPDGSQRAIPYLYTDAEIAALPMEAAATCGRRSGRHLCRPLSACSPSPASASARRSALTATTSTPAAGTLTSRTKFGKSTHRAAASDDRHRPARLPRPPRRARARPAGDPRCSRPTAAPGCATAS